MMQPEIGGFSIFISFVLQSGVITQRPHPQAATVSLLKTHLQKRCETNGLFLFQEDRGEY